MGSNWVNRLLPQIRSAGTTLALMKIAPEARQVKITYKLPEPIMITPLAGGGFEPPASGL